MSTLVLNLGLKSIRSIIIDDNGKKQSFSSQPISTAIQGRFVTQNPNEWWQKAKEVINMTVEEYEVRKNIKRITVTSSAACLIPVDYNGDSLYDSIMVSDTRANTESEFISSLYEFQNVFLNTGMAANSYLMLPKILWLKNNKPDIFNSTYKFLSPNDFFIGKLTGTFVTDDFNAQKYHYDIKNRTYPIELLRKLEIDEGTLPQVSQPGEMIGYVRNEITSEFGFSKDVKVYLSTYDAICAFIGSGPKEPGDACDVSGTVTSVRAFSNNIHLKKSSGLFKTPFNKINQYIVGGSNNLGGGLIEWVKQCYYQNEKYPYEIMELESRESNIGAQGLVFLPYLMGERSPIWNDKARGVFFGIERIHTRRDMTRAVFESAAFCTKDIVNALEENNVTVNRLRLSGGLTRVNHISQIKADVTGKEVIVVDEFETTALGAAIIVGLGASVFDNIFEAISVYVKDRVIILPNKEKHKIYNEIFGFYKDLYISLLPQYEKRKTLVNNIYSEKKEKIENL